MPLIRLNNLRTLNNVARPNLLAEDELQECENYEVIGNGNLALRKDPETFDSYLDTALDAVFSSIISISEPYYPQRKLSAMYGDYILLVYGHTGSAYVLYYFYQSGASAWTGTQIAITGHAYDSGTELEFTIGESKVIITDLDEDSENHAAFFRIDPEGTARSGILGIPAPKSKAAVTQITAWDESDWDTNADSSHVSEPGLVQVVYTVVTEDGQESNPSPVSETLDMQFFEFDDKGDTARWIGKILVSNLSIPTVSEDVKDQLKYFNVYYRVFRYSEGKEFSTFQFAQQFEIVDKNNADDTSTGNSYAIAVAVSLGEYPPYSNNVAPVAKVAAEVGGVTFLANTRDKISFPFGFYYYCPIKLTNTDNKNYVDAVVRIRLYDKDAPLGNPITNLDWDYYDTGELNVIDADKINKIRFYDADRATPLNVVYKLSHILSPAYVCCDVYVKIPVLEAGNSHLIYLCFNDVSHDLDGVTNSDYQTYEYGKWLNYTGLSENTFEDDFEDGDLVKWSDVGSDWNVTDAVVKSGEYSAICDVTVYESENAKLELSGTWRNLTIEGDIRVNHEDGVCQKATVGGRSDTTSYLYYALSMRPKNGGEANHFQYYDGTEYQNFPNDKTWLVNTWYHFKITYNFYNSIQKTWVDSDYLGERTMLDGHGEVMNSSRYFEKISIFGSSGWASDHDYLYLDNITITTVTIENFITNQKVFSGERVKSANSIICARADFEHNFYNKYNDSSYRYEKLPNKSNVAVGGNIYTDNDFYVIPIGHIPALDQYIGVNAIRGPTSVDGAAIINFLRSGTVKLTSTIVKKFTMWGRFKCSSSSVFSTADRTIMYVIADGSADYHVNLELTYDSGPPGKWKFHLDNNGDDHTFGLSVNITTSVFSIILSVDFLANKCSLFVFNPGISGDLFYEEEDTVTFNAVNSNPFESISWQAKAWNDSSGQSFIDQIQFITDLYLSASDDNNVNTAYNILNFMPAFDNLIGYSKFVSPFHNNNIKFGDTETIVYKEYQNMLRWSNIDGYSFPALYNKNTREPILRLISAPSFLKLQYANTVIVFSRNYVYRFVLIGSPDEWRARSESLIEDHTSYGLLARESLVKVSNMVLWLSEFGVILWNENDVNLISKDILDITLKDTLLGFFCPIRNQYILHDNQFASVSGNTFTFATNKISFPYAHYWTVNGFRIGDIILVTDTVNNNKTFLISAFSKTNYDNDTITVTGAVAETPANCTIRATRSYVFDFNNGKVSRYLFSGLDISKALILSGGTASENVNLFLSSVDISVNKYPGATATTAIARLLSRLVYLGFALVKRIRATFTGSVSITVKAWHRTYPTTGYKTTTFSSPTSTQWRGITNGNQRAREVEVLVENASTLESIDLEVTPLGN